MNFWRGNVDRLLEFNDKKILSGAGSISNAEMEERVREIYAQFDQKRKGYTHNTPRRFFFHYTKEKEFLD